MVNKPPLISMIALSLMGIPVLISLVVECRLIHQLFCSKTRWHVSSILKVTGMTSVTASMIAIYLNLYLVLSTAFESTFADYGINASIVVEFCLPVFVCLLKVLMYIIFVGQIYALFAGTMYPLAKRTMTYVIAMVFISIFTVVLAIVIELMDIFPNDIDSALLQTIYRWDFLILNVNDLLLSITVIYLFLIKLFKSLHYSRSTTFMANNIPFFNGGRNEDHVFVDEELGSTAHKKKLPNVVSDEELIQKTNTDYGNSIESYAVNDIKESMVHIVTRYAILAFFAIVSTEVVYISLLNERFVHETQMSITFEIVRVLQALASMFAGLCIYLHFQQSFAIYICLCGKCHHCLYGRCNKCVEKKYTGIASPNLNDWDGDDVDEVSYMKL